MRFMQQWDDAMRLALAEARKSGQDVPVGAILLDGYGDIVAEAHNEREILKDPTAHAEILAIKRASESLGSWRLDDLTLVVTLEPCLMCAGAIVSSRIGRVVFGAWDQRVGAAGSLYDVLRDSRLGEPVEVIPGVLEQECSQLLKEFFEAKR